MAQLLIAKGININQKDERGNNVPMTLCEESTRDEIVEVAQLFVDNGIKVNHANKDGKKAADLLTKNLKLTEPKKK